mgnify:CR=1 FL=1
MGAINPNAFYGAVRGMEDARVQGNNQEAFVQDQAIRREALDQSRAQAPLRTKALELGIREGEQKLTDSAVEAPMRRGILQNQLDVSNLTKAQMEQYNKTLKEASERRNKLHAALGSNDPQKVAETMAGIYPEAKIQNPKAEVGPDGTITFTGTKEDGTPLPPKVYAPTKTASGQPVDAWTAMSIDVANRLDPVKTAQDMFAHQLKQGDEEAKQKTLGAERAAVARINAGAKEDAAAGKKDDAFLNRQHARIKPVLDSMMKTMTPTNALIAGYSNNDDPALRQVIETRTEAIIENDGKMTREAANQAIEEVRDRYGKIKARTETSAAALAAAGINPRDEKAVAAAAKAGNAAAADLIRALEVTKKALGTSVASHLRDQLKAPKK